MTDPALLNADLTPPLPSFVMTADEPTTLVDMLDYYRAVLARKGSGLSTEQLDTALAPSNLTIGALIHHMAFVEDFWFEEQWLGHVSCEPWASIDWDSDPDGEMTMANTLTPDELFAQFDVSLARSRAAYAEAGSLDQLAVGIRANGDRWNLRWIMVHMIEEYARHCGHADFIRQSIDGITDD